MITYGGPRLPPEHFENSDRVPPEVARFGVGDPALPVGSPGKVGLLELAFERHGDRTELVRRFQKSPLQIMRPLYYDEARPDLPYTLVTTTGGGVLQGDRQRLDVSVGPGAAAHLGTQSHTKLYRMEEGYATSVDVRLDLAADAYLEYLPDPVIPFAGSRFAQHVQVRMARSATLVLGETVCAGRLSRGERHEYDAYSSDVEVHDADGRPILVDRVRLVPDGRGAGLGVLAGHDIVATFLVVTPLVLARQLADALHAAVGAAGVGVSTLPGDAGAWVRILTDDTVTVAAAWRTLWEVTRVTLTGAPPPPPRKY